MTRLVSVGFGLDRRRVRVSGAGPVEGLCTEVAPSRVGFWTKEWRDEQVYEAGWMVVPEFQSHGIAVAAIAQAIELAKRDDKHRFMHAFPTVDNAPSNAVCRKLGFELLEACEFEFPKGHFAISNNWRLDLRA